MEKRRLNLVLVVGVVAPFAAILLYETGLWADDVVEP